MRLKLLEFFLKTCILGCLVLLVIETIPSFSAFYSLFNSIEYFIFGVFLAEYTIRSIVRGKERPIPAIDLFVLVAYAISLFPDVAPIFKVLRWVALFKFTRYTVVDDQIMKAFRLVKKELIPYGVLFCVMTLVASSAMFYAENSVQPDKFPSIPHSLWWGVVTITTVGYGDVYPISILGKVIAAISVILGLAVTALPIGLWTSAFFKIREDEAGKKD